MKTILLCVFTACSNFAFGQVIPFDSEQWKFSNNDHKFVNYLGKESVLLTKSSAVLSGVNFENGVIEYDMAFPQGRAFIGLQFRMENEKNFEEFYVRPHQSGNPDANQYTPVFNGNAAWQLYYGEGYAAPVKYEFNNWIHFKLVIRGQFMEVYIGDMEMPVLFAELKRKSMRGNIGISNAINSSYFANVSIQHNDSPVLKGKPAAAKKIESGTVEQWSISQSFNLEKLLNVFDLKNFGLKPKYSPYKVEPTGTVNISMAAEVNENGNTVLAKVVIESDRDQIKRLTFGFSDRVIVFVNGKAIFYGDDGFTSRDYRFLGTIGYFDAVFADLKNGQNEIIFAVSESFGGWGLKAKFEDPTGLKMLY